MSALGLAAVLALAPQRGEPPESKLLGWLVLFVMVVWPLIRGVVEAANKRRREFIEAEERREREARRARRRAAAGGGRPERADPLEALRRALMGRVEPDDDEDGDEAPAPRATPAPPPARAAVRPAPPPNPAGEDVVGDPFDERVLERPLVEDAGLARVPSEGGSPSDAPDRRRGRAPRPPVDAPPPAADLLVVARLARRARSPWAQGVLYEELLGPPVAFREPRDF